MPSSGLPIENIGIPDDSKYTDNKNLKAIYYIRECAEKSIKHNLFHEWLESFVGAWNKTHDPIMSANAGLIEWDII